MTDEVKTDGVASEEVEVTEEVAEEATEEAEA